MISWEQQTINLVKLGTPLFPLRPEGDQFAHPKGWQNYPVPTLNTVSAWLNQGYGLAAVSGETFDYIDLDTDEEDCYDQEKLERVIAPLLCGHARTPSGGHHYLLPSLGCKSTRYAPGLDVKSGYPHRTGRGNIKIAPTTKAIGRYEWVEPVTSPTPEQLALVPVLKSSLERLLEAREKRLANGIGLSTFTSSTSPWLAWNAAKKNGDLTAYFTLMGGRDNGVFLLCASLVGSGKYTTVDEIVTELEINDVHTGVAMVESDHAWDWSLARVKAQSALNMQRRGVH